MAGFGLDFRPSAWQNMRDMKFQRLLTLALPVLCLCSCSLLPPKEVSRTELFKPDMYTAMDYTELTDMMYYGSDADYDYFSRGSFRYKVKRSENAVPAAVRTDFTSWSNGRMYRSCLMDTYMGGSGTAGTSAADLKAAAAQKINTFLQNRAARH